MPIYEYDCPKCGQFERHQSISDPTLKRCPSCRSKVTKLISSSAFTLKGGGWYADSYQKKSGSPSTGTGASSGGDSSSSSSAPTPSAPASKASD